MALTAQTFKDLYPEFENLGDTLIEARLVAARLACPSDTYGDYFDYATALHAARSLALSPAGRDLRLESDQGKTIYDEELRRLRLIVSLRGRLV
jgi:hypothetical protein